MTGRKRRTKVIIMKKIIEENQRGYLIKDGKFTQLLEPGAHTYWPFLGYKIIEVKFGFAEKVDTGGLDLSVLRRDPNFVSSTASVEVPDDAIALRYVDGRLFGVLTPGDYCFWNVDRLNTFEILDIKDPEGAASLAPYIFQYMASSLYVKIEVPEGNLAFLYYDGVYKKLLAAGTYYFWNQGVKVKPRFIDLRWQSSPDNSQEMLTACQVDIGRLELESLKADPVFQEQSTSIEVPDDHLALVSINGRLTGALPAGEFFFWKIGRNFSHELVDIKNPDSAGQLPEQIFGHIGHNFYAKVEVPEGEVALLYFNEVFQRVLAQGTHYFWQGGPKVTFRLVDLRWQQLELNGQEILTADKVSLRLNFVCRYKINDPVKAVNQHKNLEGELHALVQLAVRELIGRCRFDELLKQKESLADQILEKLLTRQDDFSITFTDAGLRDIILPGEIREIMNQVLVAEKTAQASVITRREEIASTRSLLETSKLLEENATLYRLKEMEFIERICDKVGNISLDSGNNLLDGLRRLISLDKPKNS